MGLAQRELNKNFLGVDVKGHRFHKGAKDSLEMGLKNVAFLRARIEFIEAFFEENELDEIWLTFSDPMPNDHDGNRRITSGYFMSRYAKLLKSGGVVHIKHDNTAIYERALIEIPQMGGEIILHDTNIYESGFLQTVPNDLKEILEIRTYYEQMWLSEGRKIKYIQAIMPIKK